MDIKNTVNKYNKDIFINTKTLMTKEHIDKIGEQIEKLTNNAMEITEKMKNIPEPSLLTQDIAKISSMEKTLSNLNSSVLELSRRLTAIEAGENTFVKVSGVSLSETFKELTVNDTFTLTPTITPKNAYNKKVIWLSSDASKATVNNGLVTAKSSGACDITCTTEDGNKSVKCTLTIKPLIIPVTSVKLNESAVVLNETQTVNLSPTITPDNATNKNVIWESSDKTIASVNNGLVTALKEGSSTITCRTQDENKSATCGITVNKIVIPVQSITLNATDKSLDEQTSFKLIATITPANATDKEIIWSSSNEAIATVDQEGNITSIKAGSCQITCKTKDGRIVSTCNIRVSAKIVPVTSVNITQASANVNIGGTVDLNAVVMPTNATNTGKTWTSSAMDIATVDVAGRVKGIKAGKSTIRVTTNDGAHTDICEVTVQESITKVDSVTLDTTEKTMNKNDKLQLTATIVPANATNKNVTWTSSNGATTSVDKNGLVTAKRAGRSTITCTTADGNKTATCEVTVQETVPAVEV